LARTPAGCDPDPAEPSRAGPDWAAGQLIISVLRHFRCYISSVLHQSLQPQPPPSSRNRHSHTNPQADSLPSMKSDRNAYRSPSADLVRAHLHNRNTPKTMKNAFAFVKLRALTYRRQSVHRKRPILYEFVQPAGLVRLVVFRELYFTIPYFGETQSRNGSRNGSRNIKNCPQLSHGRSKRNCSHIIQ